jgi:hypothetical protein
LLQHQLQHLRLLPLLLLLPMQPVPLLLLAPLSVQQLALLTQLLKLPALPKTQ